jgi:serine-type D-Ala-D-Ala carboxypeptidase (penicillin-binding protein 5/6)
MRHKKHPLRFVSLLLAGLLLLYSGTAWIKAAHPTVAAAQTLKQLDYTSVASALSWPSYGQAAVGAEGYGLLDKFSSQIPVPTASTAKIMTAYAVLKVKPLTIGQQTSPTLTMTQADVDIYNDFIAKDGSVVAVVSGEQLSEYQALQALMLPSGNNIADSLAIWAFGSVANYLSYADELTAEIGMPNTHIEDASGYSPLTVSTAEDMVHLALAAMKDPVFAQIVGQSTATVPVAGLVHNVNGLLGRDNIIGVKTGNTDEAGGCFVAAANHVVDGKTITLVTAIMAAPNLTRSMLDSLPLLASAKANFASATILPKATTIGTYAPSWTKQKVALQTAEDIKMVLWKGSRLKLDVGIEQATAPLEAHANVGTVFVHTTGVNAKTAIITSVPISSPSVAWRLRHPL